MKIFIYIALAFSVMAFSVTAAAADAPDTGAFSVKNDRVLKNGAELDCDEVYAMPEGIENGVAHWALFNESTSTEAEMGVWFFGEDGEYSAFIPAEIQAGHQEILWSPAGDWFALVSGPGDGPWGGHATYELWALGGEGGEGPHKIADFSGMREHFAWMPDGARVVFARLDGDRDMPDGSVDPYAPKVSAALYDPATGEEIVLKEATETQNYYLGDIDWENAVRVVKLDGNDIVLNEESVKSPQDWGGEGMEAGKYQTLKIKVPVPPAG